MELMRTCRSSWKTTTMKDYRCTYSLNVCWRARRAFNDGLCRDKRPFEVLEEVNVRQERWHNEMKRVQDCSVVKRTEPQLGRSTFRSTRRRRARCQSIRRTRRFSSLRIRSLVCAESTRNSVHVSSRSDFDSPLSDVSSNAPFLLASTLPTSTAISSRTATKKYVSGQRRTTHA